jgi:hypothetical protein
LVLCVVSMSAAANYMGVLAVLPGTYMLAVAGYQGKTQGGRLEEVRLQPGEILYTAGTQPMGGGPYEGFMAYLKFRDVHETSTEYIYPGDEVGSREEV